MEVCSDKMIEYYLLYKNPLYAFRLPIALLVGIIAYGYFSMLKWSDNSYINQILVPLAAILLTMVILDMISRMLISKEEKRDMLLKCKQFMAQPSFDGKLDLSKISEYKGTIEGFNTKENSQENPLNNIQIPKEKINELNDTTVPQVGLPMDPNYNQLLVDNNMNSTLYTDIPQPLESKKYDAKCIEPSNCLSLCSGSGQNPCNLISAVPGPQWLPQTAEVKQNELVNNQFTPSLCQIK